MKPHKMEMDRTVDLYPADLVESLEFDVIKGLISNHAVTPSGREGILRLLPSSDLGEVTLILSRVNEILAVYQSERSIPAIATESIDDALSLMRIHNAVLETDQFMAIKALVDSYNNIHRFVQNLADLLLPMVSTLFSNDPPNLIIPAEIDKVLERNGTVKSNASPELSKIRHELVKKRSSADRIFYRALKKYNTAGVLGEITESFHEDRRVLAVQASFKGRVNGIFHGSSAKNSLVYIEPGECIEINNEVSMLIDDERKEIRRILRQLTRTMAQHRDELIRFSSILVEFDTLHARAVYAFRNDGVLPRISKEPVITLKKAINPVLQHFNASKGKAVIPLDIHLDQEERILVISGPNAGGKSITLKTVGLMQMMIQSGILLPIHPDSEVGLFDRIMGDIGDSQSIENELSTYSSKLEKMKVFLEEADPSALFLIDEFGSGSDPELGSALAQVFLERLNVRKAFGVITTHYNNIKALASELPGTLNGSMQFNQRSFRPEFILNVGTPGSSYTFEVAEKSGIPKEMIEAAKGKLDERTVSMDRLLVNIQEQKRQIKRTRNRTEKELKRLSSLEKQQEHTIHQLEDKLQKYSQVNEEQSKVLMWGKRFESLVEAWMKADKSKDRKEVIGRFVEMLKARSGERGREIRKEEKKMSKKRAARIEELQKLPVKVGDTVRLLDSNRLGEVLEIKKDKFEIRFGNLRTLVSRDQFIHADQKV
ncbi:MAG: hypothetical protein LPK47_07955 [Bacteroidota bacterium]|nr:hypothetical protein [Bacteroidota bacterium]